jgi:hypothetical protein
MTNYLANISWWARGQPAQCFFIGLRPQLLVQFSPVLVAGLLLPGGRWRYPFCLTANILPGISCWQPSSFLSLDWISYGSRGCWWMRASPLIMTASMKVIRVVAPSGGPGGLYTAVAFPSTEYGPLFAEYVTQHKEESGKPAHHDGLHEGHQSGGPIWPPWRPLHRSRLFLNGVRTPLSAEYVTQHKEESGKPAHHDGLHEGHQSGGPIWRPRWPLHSSRLPLNSVWTPLC